MKEQYDRKTMLRQFRPGDQVLVLSPVPGSALNVRFLGPYVVDQKVSDTDYVVSTPEWQRKTRPCHVNMLKLYLSRKSPQEKHDPPAMSLVSADADDGLKVISVDRQGGKLTNSDFLREDESRLSYQRCDVHSLFFDFLHTVQGRQADALSRG